MKVYLYIRWRLSFSKLSFSKYQSRFIMNYAKQNKLSIMVLGGMK